MKKKNVTLTFSWRSAKHALVKRRTYLLCSLSVLVVVFGVYHMTRTYASIAELSPASCLGGWEGAENAGGKPDAPGSEPEAFTAGNSAVLKSGSASELYCGKFVGDIPEETSPKDLILRPSWPAAP